MYDESVRQLALTLIGATLGLGGAALAQPSLVVDPWGRSTADSSSWFEPETLQPEQKPFVDTELADPWAKARETAPSPVVTPIKPFETRPLERAAAAPTTEPFVIDPWAPVIASEIPSLRDRNAPTTTDRAMRLPWSDRVVEVIDPWQRTPGVASGDRVRLVIDPWAR
jgi:hypothetical protein